ncbi:RpoL/Rpb11 RNA polymerase subunit family protein [Archaeoglobus veneficus]|uniref:DNA-directed RNA polymerase subunit Rpo11 n=1 Tax=Archaeoglobus veneficus (strain DSM 11195 / SNP6) TaxID=693661 RepID=F2KQH2_ARCVS|nr:DNA-directed RNA polymerase subunit L [Archaeoglobus veneficus]AEA47705.1 DNA-directed RNA polymerase subunit L [Archaeoglobus veneficus SNP6]
MEVKIIEMGDDFVRLLVKGEDHTFLNLLQHYLLEDEDVVVAKYHISHPLVGEPELFVRTNGKNPLDAIKEANEKIAKYCEELISQL